MEAFTHLKTGENALHLTDGHTLLLPVRAEPSPWEDLPSLLCRIAREIGYPDPRWILHPQGSSYGIKASDLPLLSKPRDIVLLQQLLLLDETTLHSLTAHTFAPFLNDFALSGPNGLPQLRSHLYSTFFLEYPQTRVCPQCLEEAPPYDPYDRQYWRMKYVFFCPLHRTRLRETCPHCSRSISALRLEPFRCSFCQQGDYREQVSEPIAQSHLFQMATVLFLRALGITFPEGNFSWQQVCPLLPQEASHAMISFLRKVMSRYSKAFSLEELLTFLLALSALSTDDLTKHAEIFTTSETAAFFLYHALLLQWPTHFFGHLDLLYTLAAPPFLGQARTAVVEYCHQLFSHAWFASAYHSHFESYQSSKERAYSIQVSLKSMLTQLNLPGNRQTSHAQPELLFLEEQHRHSPAVRIVPFPWETLPSVLTRAADQSGQFHPALFLRPTMNSYQIEQQQLLTLNREADYTLLSYALQLDSQTLHHLTIHRFAEVFQRFDGFLAAETYPTLEINARLWLFPDTSHIRICPLCLQEEAYDRLYWMARVFVICPSHFVRLRATCPWCKNKIPSLRPSMVHCPSCTGDYRRAPSPAFPKDHLLSVASGLFLQTLGIPLSPSWCLPAHLAPSPLSEISAKHYFRLLEGIACEFFGELPDHTLLRVLKKLKGNEGNDQLQQEDGKSDPLLLAIMLFHELFTCWPTHFLEGLDALCRTIRVPPYRRFVYGMEQCQRYFQRLFDDPGLSWLRQTYEQYEQHFYRSIWYQEAASKEWEGFQWEDPLF